MIIKIFKRQYYTMFDYDYYIPLNNNKVLAINKNDIFNDYDVRIFRSRKLSNKIIKISINDNLYKMLLSEDMTIVNMGVNIIIKKYII